MQEPFEDASAARRCEGWMGTLYRHELMLCLSMSVHESIGSGLMYSSARVHVFSPRYAK